MTTSQPDRGDEPVTWHTVNKTLLRAEASGYETLLWPTDGDGGAWTLYHVLGAFVADRGSAAHHTEAHAQAETALRAAAARHASRTTTQPPGPPNPACQPQPRQDPAEPTT